MSSEITSTGSFEFSTDIQASQQSDCRTFDILFRVVGTFAIALLGFVGNTLSVIVLWKDRNKSATNFLLIVLAFVDDAVILTNGVMVAIPSMCQAFNTCPMTIWAITKYGQYGWPLSGLTHMSTTYITLSVTIIRYIAVCQPHKASKWATVRVAHWQAFFIITFVILYHIVRFFEYGVIYDDEAPEVPILVRSKLAQNAVYQYIFQVVLYYMLIYIIPLTTLCFMTYKLYWGVKKAKERRTQMASHEKNKADKEDEITRALIAVVIVFVICQLINPIRRIIFAMVTEEQWGCPYLHYYVSGISNFAIMLNSAINFVLYCVFAKRFRKNLRKFLRCPGEVGSADITTAGEDTTQMNATY